MQFVQSGTVCNYSLLSGGQLTIRTKWPDKNAQVILILEAVKALVLAVKKTPKRQVTKATFDKWHQDNDRDHQTLVWLRCELERDNVHVAVLFCDVCKHYKDSIVSLRNFQMTWITGTINLMCCVPTY